MAFEHNYRNRGPALYSIAWQRFKGVVNHFIMHLLIAALSVAGTLANRVVDLWICIYVSNQVCKSDAQLQCRIKIRRAVAEGGYFVM